MIFWGYKSVYLFLISIQENINNTICLLKFEFEGIDLCNFCVDLQQ